MGGKSAGRVERFCSKVDFSVGSISVSVSQAPLKFDWQIQNASVSSALAGEQEAAAARRPVGVAAQFAHLRAAQPPHAALRRGMPPHRHRAFRAAAAAT